MFFSAINSAVHNTSITIAVLVCQTVKYYHDRAEKCNLQSSPATTHHTHFLVSTKIILQCQIFPCFSYETIQCL